MDTKHSCHCCLLRPPDKDLKIPYSLAGKTEIYADMLKECFEIHLTTLSSNGECGICEVCVGRLRDASDFKLQVQRSQAELQARLQGALLVKEEEPSVKSEMSDYGVEDEAPIYEEVKAEVLEDPLPNDGNEVFMEFVLNFENQVSSVWKQEPLLEFAPITESSPRSLRSRSVGYHRFDAKKLKKEHARPKLAHHNLNCQHCNIQFKYKRHFDLHNESAHVGEKPYTCEVCCKKFATNRKLSKHKHVHIEKRYRCPECDKLFSNPHNLKIHKVTHSGHTYNCDICNAKFKSKRALIAHVGKHVGQMNFRCEYCPKKFWDYGSMVIHKRIHEDIQIYRCDVCNKVFTLKSSLGTHLKTHTDRKYPCEICTAELASQASLRQHKLRHTGEKPYACEYCNKQFRYKHNLTSHVHIHTGEKAHCCEVCGKQFGRKDNLKTHLEIHAEGKRFSCELCDKSYPTKEGLRQHRRTHLKNVKSLKRQKIEYIGNIIP